MTEKDVYKNGVALLEEWEDVNYCEHSFKFKDEWLTDKEVVDLLNELAEENKALKKQLQSEHQQLENAILLERTRMGKNCLKQFRDAIQ
jgi:hypothetical protein